MRTLPFVAFAFTILIGFAAYIASRLSHSFPAWRWLIWGLTGAQVLLTVGAFATLRRNPREGLVPYLHWAAFTGMGVAAVLLVGLAAIDLAGLFGALVGKLQQKIGQTPWSESFSPDRRRLFMQGLHLSLSGTAVGLAAVGFGVARRVAQVVEVEVPVEGLHPDLEGFRIAQISDIHVGPTIDQSFLEAIVERVNEQRPDLVAITGDLVDGSVEHIGAEVAPLGRLQATHGAWFCTGNHEYYSGVHQWVGRVRELGVKALLNEHEVITHGAARVLVAGVTDHSAERVMPAHRSDPTRAVQGAPPVELRLLLAHQPRSAYAAAEVPGGFDLQLSGHTHGGQFIPWNFIIHAAQPFARGLHRLGRMWIYTNPGTGYWGPPNRAGIPSEITLLKLKRA